MSKQVTRSFKTKDPKEAIKFMEEYKFFSPSKDVVFEIKLWSEVPEREMTKEQEEENKFRELLFEGKGIPEEIKCGVE